MTALDIPSLSAFLDGVVPGGIDGELAARLLSGGRSNPTYEIADASRTWILRRPPFGHVLPTAHDMAREHRVLTALHGTAVPVPRTLALCRDADVIGAPFYLMEKVLGRTLRTGDDTGQLTTGQQRRLSEAVVSTLTDLHLVDPEEVGLADWGRPAGYLERQLGRWREQGRAMRAERPEVEELLARLDATMPATGRTGIVHGDFKLDNLMVSLDDPTVIVGVLDWEMSTLGDTLADLGLLLSFWDRPGEPPNPITRGATAFEGFFSRGEVIDCYSRKSGVDLAGIDWYVSFSDLKVAVILAGMHRRHLAGQTVGDGFEGLGEMVGWLLARALERTSARHPASRATSGRRSGRRPLGGS